MPGHRGRLTRTTPLFVLLAGFLVHPLTAQDPPKPPTADQFDLRVEPVVALHSGPVLVRTDFRYTGPGGIRIIVDRFGENARPEPPAGWKAVGQMRAYSGPTVRTRELKTGDAWSEYYSLHQWYSGIGPGEHELTFHWYIRFRVPAGTEPLKTTRAVKLTVGKPTADRAARLRHLIRDAAKRPRPAGLSDFDPDPALAALVGSFEGTTDPLLLDVLFDLFDDDRIPVPLRDRLTWAVSRFRILGSADDDLTADEQANVVAAACRYLTRPAPTYAAPVVAACTGPWAPAGFTAAFRPGLADRHPIARAAFYAAEPAALDEGQVRTLMKDLAGLYVSPRAAELAAHVRRLESDAYRERVRAADELRRGGWAALVPLRARLREPASVDLEPRLRKLVEGLEGEDRAENFVMAAKLLGVLKGERTPAARAVLRALADNPADLWPVREARAELDRAGRK